MKSSTLKTKDFKFKQFSVEGGHSGMPVSTDGVLLGAWAFTHSPNSILDIGTGTGLLALMSAQRFPDAYITAVEIDDFAFATASHNSAASPWSSRIQVIHSDILHTPFVKQFDAIICNPPYFNDGERSQHQQRATARHTTTLSHQDLLLKAKNLLHPNGNACFVLPKYEGELFISLAKALGWHISRLCTVQPTVNKPVHRLLIELSLTAVDTVQSHLVIHSQDGYSEEFIALTKDFYLKM
ncbi:tRNA1(Val) (adenine(37)-N6)-methyltransferase [Vibrio aestuarianus]|uniref:tRNA1(Val) (adenine(37)-N6)-methyltransferase n=1 Tax=Vibrio aestuarianus TaxID=28171 RepID=A0ABM9FSN3_9VIBR|nr:tRNA1(Val) (adenine(37)-N6)-methyltransferase [Vibrio aestuarianus]MDE1212144.1 tRNA1(Val) (adenine(37)-N6)-methyltransferase [Vibrio aestuarianus]MDE1217695.1 tRNA1(Val) (adenine(37)-N6)-methyltransferase [Vibrio aestuarianus]MDE1226228.1 tRNA1(Val) (adenine(37)-N6)-methyltransferase [Vibrio aestuarianus]MDE1257433.1 tRNA1(Val) (adenine(37)-N6)-methyltransferase [Vibrio aestuarianus]MDE1259270.1 tRNA1(Val) (adenine(37)-N6)-methyltransferase [Vibrio aestuarianus]